MKKKLRFAKVRDVKSPEYGTSKSAGIDFFVPNDFKPTVVLKHSDLLIPSGIRTDIPEGFMLLGADKSGVVTSRYAYNRTDRQPKPAAFPSPVIIGAKVIDEDYQGELHIHIINVGTESIIIKPGMKIAQFILVPVEYAELEEVPESELFMEITERGSGGFGSTN